MPYLPPNLQKRQQQQAAAPTLGGGAPATAAGPSGSAPAAAPVNTGSGWTNLQDYLTANSPQIGKETAQTVGTLSGLGDFATEKPADNWESDYGRAQHTGAQVVAAQEFQRGLDKAKKVGSQPGLDAWLRNASGQTGQIADLGNKYSTAGDVAGYHYQPTVAQAQPVNEPGATVPSTIGPGLPAPLEAPLPEGTVQIEDQDPTNPNPNVTPMPVPQWNLPSVGRPDKKKSISGWLGG